MYKTLLAAINDIFHKCSNSQTQFLMSSDEALSDAPASLGQ